MLPGITPALFDGGPGGNDAFTVLLLHCDGVSGAQGFIDSSPAHHAVGSGTAAGAAITTLQAKFGGSSVALAPNPNGYLAVGTSSDFDFGTADFTIDWWEYRLDAADSRPVIVRNAGVQTYQAFLVGYAGSGTLVCYASSNNAAWDILNGLSMGAIAVNTWVHFALVRKGTTFYTFRNGVLIATVTSALAFPASAGALCIGIWNITGTQQYNFNGYLDEFRISKGIARWTANFTPPAKPYGPDPDLTVKLLLNMSGPDNSTAFTDTSPQNRGNATVLGTPKIASNFAKFDGSANSYLYFADSPDWNVNADFTVECWAWINIYPPTSNAFSFVAQGDGTNTWSLFVNEGGQIYFQCSIAGTYYFPMGPSATALKTWNHCAAVYTGGKLTVYVNGVAGAPITVPPIPDIAAALVLGAYATGGVTPNVYWLNGFLDDVTITRKAKYTSNFTPPPTPLTPPGIAMPTIVATATTNNAANTTHSVNLPAGNVGDMLIVFIGGGGITAANGGWTSLDTLSAVYRVATGADALSVTLSGSFTLTAVAYRIRGYAGVPEAVSVTAASVTTIDPPALTPSWGLADNLWFASCIYSYPSAITLTATPANYGDAIFIPPAIGPNNSAVYTSTRFLRATSDDPGVFNLSAATQPRGRTVAIRGA